METNRHIRETFPREIPKHQHCGDIPAADRYDHLELNLRECGYESCAPGHSWGPGVRRYPVIHYISSGRGTLTINGKQYGLGPGEGFCVSAGEEAEYRADDRDPWSYRWVGFTGTRANILLSETTLPETKVFRYEEDDFFERNLRELYEYSRLPGKEEADCMTQGQLYLFLGGLLRHFAGEPSSRPETEGAEYVGRAVSVIRRKYMDSLSVNALAKEVHVSRSYLYKLFMQHRGQSPMAYLQNYRLAKACELLRSTDLTPAEVAKAVGYDNVRGFYQKFRQVMGASPGAYRAGTMETQEGGK